MRSKAVLAIPAALGLAAVAILAGCSGPQATQDRGSGGGKNPDSTQDATNVKVFLNANKVPNIAIFCVNPGDGHGPMAIMSTLSGGDTGATKASSIMRMPDLDVSYCKGSAR